MNNITPDELYEAIRVSYQAMKDNPDDFTTAEEALANVEESAASLVQYYQGIIAANRANNQ
jgi:hypothetical protein